jgi:hemerythrin-like domain-containing protein
MSSEPIDVSEMYAVHDAMRQEYASLPLIVKSVDDGDTARAAVVSEHIALLGRLMHLHHAGEDEILWPLAQERMPEHEAVFVMHAEHGDLNDQLRAISVLSDDWAAVPSATNRAALHTALIAFERTLLKHLGHEESDALPLLAQAVTDEEFGALRTYVRAGLTPDEGTIILGMILDDTGASRGSGLLAAVDPADREAFDSNGGQAYHAYRARLLGG